MYISINPTQCQHVNFRFSLWYTSSGSKLINSNDIIKLWNHNIMDQMKNEVTRKKFFINKQLHNVFIYIVVMFDTSGEHYFQTKLNCV